MTSSSIDAPVSPTVPSSLRESTEVEDLVRNSRIMIVDDEQFNILVVRRFLELEGYRDFISVTDSTRAIDQIRSEKPDLVLLDIMMPEVSGLDILSALRADESLRQIPVLILTAKVDAETKKQALELRAMDFLAKPVDPNDLVPRVRNALIVKSYQDRLASHAEELEAKVQRRTAELAHSRQQIVHCLARAAEYRDNDTGMHVVRVGKYVGVIARALGFVESRVEMIELASQLHDVGKIGLPDSILLFNGPLHGDQRQDMQRHCAVGKRILEPMSASNIELLKSHARMGAEIAFVPTSPLLMLASRIAQTHHEWWDGSGYPLGLAGNDIPVEGRMTAIADVFDALSSRRTYKEPIPRETCFEMMEENGGTQFDPKLLQVFFDNADEIIDIQIQFMETAV
jgi:putative two-component system response regulator